jgi:hypothetical protein
MFNAENSPYILHTCHKSAASNIACVDTHYKWLGVVLCQTFRVFS